MSGLGAGIGKKMQKGVARHLSPLTAPQVLTTRALLELLKEKVKMEMNAKVAAH